MDDSVRAKLEQILQRIGEGDSAEATSRIDALLRDDIEPLCSQPCIRHDLSKMALTLRADLLAMRSTIVRGTGEALGIAFGALAKWPHGGQP